RGFAAIESNQTARCCVDASVVAARQLARDGIRRVSPECIARRALERASDEKGAMSEGIRTCRTRQLLASPLDCSPANVVADLSWKQTRDRKHGILVAGLACDSQLFFRCTPDGRRFPKHCESRLGLSRPGRVGI